jgi:hypothetical protein
MDAKLTNRMEIVFWDLFIYKLSEKPWVRRAVRAAYQLMPKEGLRESMMVMGVLAATGFASGILVYLVVASWI